MGQWLKIKVVSFTLLQSFRVGTIHIPPDFLHLYFILDIAKAGHYE